MCGIIAGFNTNPKKGKNKKAEKINNFIVDQYQDQCSRGTKGFGIIRIAENGRIELDRATEEIKFLLDLYLKPAKMIIAHHRQPTASDNKLSQTHPIFISNKMLQYDYYFVHNGVISNDTKLKEKHEKLGFKYITQYEKEGYYNQGTTTKFNDSEALGIEVALLIEEKQDKVESDNTAAFIALQVDKKTHKASKVFFGRSGVSSCLNLSIKKGEIRISSEGEGEEVVVDTLWSFDPKDPKMKLSSKGMIFKKPEEPAKESPYAGRHIHQNPLPVGVTVNKAIEGTKLTEKVPATEGGGELVVIEERNWNKNKVDESITEVNYDDDEYDDIFVDKNYQEEVIQQFKETIKEDDSEMIESDLDVALDEQVDRIGKMMGHFQKVIQNRNIDQKERGFYLSQTYKVLKTMEALANLADEDYNEKQIQEEIKKEEEKDPYNVNNLDSEDRHMGYRAGRRVHNYKTGEMEDIDDDYLGFNRFG